jgi:pimeloyl-ACP methyl ester carboxylesterase
MLASITSTDGIKTAYIIPGYKENVHGEGYAKIISLFERQNTKVVPVNIQWEYRTFSNYVSQLLAQIKSNHRQPILLGFSFGAVVAFLSAPLVHPEKLYLCSLSPFFKEDLSMASKQSLKSLGKKRKREMEKISFHESARRVTCATTLIVGSAEEPAVILRTQEASKLIKSSTLTIADGASHCVSDPKYFNTLRNLILYPMR